MQQIAVVGAGLFGRLLALRLARLDYRVSLYEKDDLDATGSAGYVAAAMLAPYAEACTASPLVIQLGIDSLELWPGILEDLPEPVFFQRQGSLIVAHSQDRGDYQNFVRRVQHKLGHMHLDNVLEPCDSRQLQSYEPELAKRFQQGLFIKGEGQLDNRALYRATRQALELNQIESLTGTRVEQMGDGYVASNHGQQRYDTVIDCRGIGAKKDIPGLRGVRGEVIRMHAPEVNLTRPVRLMHPRYPLYIVPRPGREYIIGATEIESEDTSNISVRSTLELLTAAYSLHSGFAEARILETLVGTRPALPDNEPRILIGHRHLQVNGLYRHGYLVSPALLNEVAGVLGAKSLDDYPSTSRFPELFQPMEAIENDNSCDHQRSAV